MGNTQIRFRKKNFLLTISKEANLYILSAFRLTPNYID